MEKKEPTKKALQHREERVQAKRKAEELGPDWTYCTKCRKEKLKEDMWLNKDGTPGTTCKKHDNPALRQKVVKTPVKKPVVNSPFAKYKKRIDEKNQKNETSLEMMTEDKFQEMWWEFLKLMCNYCGDDFNDKVPHMKLSIDRICENKGYVLGNCLQACRRCNYMRGCINNQNFSTPEDFIKHCIKIANFHKPTFNYEIRVYPANVRFMIL